MVQSIFDDPEEERPRDAPLSLIPQDLPDQPPAAPVIDPPFLDERENVWTPPDPSPSPNPGQIPINQLDGTQRQEYQPTPQNVYSPMFTQPDAETVRRSGLAWSMGVIFFGSVVIMLLIGWGADLLFGSSPWGLVLGIVLGSVIGFIQFFRISSQIYEVKKSGPEVSPLMSAEEEPDKDRWL